MLLLLLLLLLLCVCVRVSCFCLFVVVLFVLCVCMRACARVFFNAGFVLSLDRSHRQPGLIRPTGRQLKTSVESN